MELSNPFRSPPGGREPQVKLPTVSPRDYAKLYVMLGGFVFLVVAMLGMRAWILREEARQKRLERPIETVLRPESAEFKLARRLRELCAPFPDGSAPLDPAALAAVTEFLAKEAPGDRISALVNDRLSPPALLVDPAGGRGAVLKLKIEVSASTPSGDRHLVDGKAAGSGLPLRLLSTTAGTPGSWADVHGVFLRVQDAAPGRLEFLAATLKPGLAPQDPNAPAPTTSPEAKALGDAEAREQFKRLAARFDDGPEAIGVDVDRDSPDFLAAAQALVATVSPEQAARLAAPAKPRDLVKDPAKHRGEFVRLRGRLIYIWTHPVAVTTPLGLKTIYEGYLGDVEGPLAQRVPVKFLMATKPEGKFTITRNRQGEEFMTDWVDLEGVFLRLHRYQGKAEADEQVPTYTAPVLLVRNLRIVPPEKPKDPGGSFGWVVSGGAAILIAIVLFGGWMSRRHGGQRTLRMELAKGRQGRPAKPGAGAILGDEVKPPPPPPA